MEFTPYEIGMDKYGIFMKTELFGSKFFCGKLIEKFPESPLYYLQGMAGGGTHSLTVFGLKVQHFVNRSLIDNHANHKRPHPTKTSHTQHVTVLSAECKCKHNARGVSSERNKSEDGVKQEEMKL